MPKKSRCLWFFIAVKFVEGKKKGRNPTVNQKNFIIYKKKKKKKKIFVLPSGFVSFYPPHLKPLPTPITQPLPLHPPPPPPPP
ncbi:hypothetical protein, partial [Bacillus mojavensis]|uniref:hypothetical protein n=1 Tax=Bacillus mojavensis TaxID=72360 RepID=UPI001EEE73E5